MLATFANKLSIKHPSSDDPKIYYDHAIRCPIEMWFEKSYKNKYGWIIQFKASNSQILNEFKADIFKQAIRYIERRTRRPVTEVSFDEILELSRALEINKITVH